MSRIADVVQVSSTDRRISHRLQHIPCGRCYAVIEYDRGAGWSVVSKLANEHWEACPGKPHVWPARMASTPTTPPDTTIVLPPSMTLKQRSGPATESVGAANHTWIAPGCERKRKTLDQRKWELEQDEYAKNVTMKSVVCGGCDKEISLDKRSKYYPGLWRKHRGKCREIEKLERTKGKAIQAVNGNGQVSSTFVNDGSSQGDVALLSPVERYESQSAGTTRQQSVRQDDSEMSSEDEDDEGDPLESFATLNGIFYRTERYYNRSGGWAYRYATKDEITTNLFHGQGEPYAHPGSHPFGHHGPQTGCRCETPRCVVQNRVDQAVSHPDSPMSTDGVAHIQSWS